MPTHRHTVSLSSIPEDDHIRIEQANAALSVAGNVKLDADEGRWVGWYALDRIREEGSGAGRRQDEGPSSLPAALHLSLFERKPSHGAPPDQLVIHVKQEGIKWLKTTDAFQVVGVSTLSRILECDIRDIAVAPPQDVPAARLSVFELVQTVQGTGKALSSRIG